MTDDGLAAMSEAERDLERDARRRRAIARRQASDGVTITGREAPAWLTESPYGNVERDPAVTS